MVSEEAVKPEAARASRTSSIRWSELSCRGETFTDTPSR